MIFFSKKTRNLFTLNLGFLRLDFWFQVDFIFCEKEGKLHYCIAGKDHEKHNNETLIFGIPSKLKNYLLIQFSLYGII